VSFSRPREGKDCHGLLSRRVKRFVRTEREGQPDLQARLPRPAKPDLVRDPV